VSDGWIDRQMPEGQEVFLDHAGYFASDLCRAGGRLERLGFQVSSVNVQYNADGAGSLVPSGTSNRLVKLRRGFLEVLAATGETPLADQLGHGLARYEGFHVVAFTHSNMEAERSRLIETGFAMQPLVKLRRRVMTAEGERQMAYSILRTEPDAMPEGRVQLLTTHTPDLFWTSASIEHANRADALTDLLVCVDDRVEAAERFGRFTARNPGMGNDFAELVLDRGRIVFAGRERIGVALPGFMPPDMPYIAGQGIRTADIDATKNFLKNAGIAPVFTNSEMVCVGPADALGAYLLFHSAPVARPWKIFVS
jgi:hypothetical protein